MNVKVFLICLGVLTLSCQVCDGRRGRGRGRTKSRVCGLE